jgi:hypothetical protein
MENTRNSVPSHSTVVKKIRNSIPNLLIENKNIRWIRKKLLGPHFHEFLSFQSISICYVPKYLDRSFVLSLSCVKHFINAESLFKLYFVMVNSNLAYCINVYGCANKTNLEKLVQKQKQSIRIICNANYRAHTAPLLKR